MHDIEAIERATLAAVPPQRQERWDDWLLAFDDGTVGRCHSAVPLRHAAPRPDALPRIEHQYAQAGFAPVLRVPALPPFDPLREALGAQGYTSSKLTLVQTGRVEHLAGAAGGDIRVQLETAPSSEWEDVFVGEGFDPVDGASRLAILRRGRDSVFASVRAAARTVAVGSACFAAGWCGVHGMRTLPAYRGRGLAGAVLSALAQSARERGVRRCFLQVQEDNPAARSLYAGRGFATAWQYDYWRKS